MLPPGQGSALLPTSTCLLLLLLINPSLSPDPTFRQQAIMPQLALQLRRRLFAGGLARGGEGRQAGRWPESRQPQTPSPLPLPELDPMPSAWQFARPTQRGKTLLPSPIP